MKVKYILLLAYISLVTVGIFNAVAVFVNKQPADPTDLQYNERSLLQSNTQFPTCVYDTDCGNGKCYDDHGYSYCKCKGNYINFQGGICNYHQADKLELFLLSFFVGGLGVDWFMLAVPGSPQFAGYVVGGG